MSARPSPTTHVAFLNADALAAKPTARVMLVAGEAAVQAVTAALPANAVIGMHERPITQHETDALKGRVVTVWLDTEDRKAIDAVAGPLAEVAGEVRWVDTTAPEEGGKLPAAATTAKLHTGADLAAILKPRVRRWVPRVQPDGRPAPGTADGGEPPPPVRDEDDGPAVPAYSHDRLATIFAERHADRFRYVVPWSSWMVWGDGRWTKDERLEAMASARAICRDKADACMYDPNLSEAARSRTATSLVSVNTIRAVEQLARSDAALVAPADGWDADPWLLNTPSGVVDLRTGKMRPAVPGDYLTKQTSVAPDFKATPTRWLEFLNFAQDSDAAMVEFLQVFSGYSATGITTEQQFIFAYGTGGNGKGTFINTLTDILGDYAHTASMDLFTQSRHGDTQKNYALADLRGARLVTSQETEEGKRWDERMVKSLTGGDPITAARKYENASTYQPQFKLFIVGNHKPSLGSVDEAIKRRMNLAPFMRRPAVADRGLQAALREEAPAILAWVIQGAIKWHKQGLQRPAKVLAATEEYMVDQDAFGGWIDEACERSPQFSALLKDLYRSYEASMHEDGMKPTAKPRFSANLESRGFSKHRSSNGVYFRGLRVKGPQDGATGRMFYDREDGRYP